MGIINIKRFEITTPGVIEDFEEIIHNPDFKYNTSHLALSGLPPAEISDAISRAMKICRLNEIDVKEHFRMLYVFDEKTGNVYCDWRMTPQAFILVMMGAMPRTTDIARWQWKCVTTIMKNSVW